MKKGNSIQSTLGFKAQKKESVSKMSEEKYTDSDGSNYFEDFQTIRKKKPEALSLINVVAYASDSESEQKMIEENKMFSEANITRELSQILSENESHSNNIEMTGPSNPLKKPRNKTPEKDDNYKKTHFIDLGDKGWQCKACNEDKKNTTYAKSTSLTILKRHINKQHLNLDSQKSITSFFPENSKNKFSKEKCLNDLANFFISARLPFKFVENTELSIFLSNFVQFLPEENKSFKLINRRSLASMIIDKHRNAKEILKERIKNNKSMISITVDGWTSRNLEPLLGITCKLIIS